MSFEAVGAGCCTGGSEEEENRVENERLVWFERLFLCSGARPTFRIALIVGVFMVYLGCIMNTGVITCARRGLSRRGWGMRVSLHGSCEQPVMKRSSRCSMMQVRPATAVKRLTSASPLILNRTGRGTAALSRAEGRIVLACIELALFFQRLNFSRCTMPLRAQMPSNPTEQPIASGNTNMNLHLFRSMLTKNAPIASTRLWHLRQIFAYTRKPRDVHSKQHVRPSMAKRRKIDLVSRWVSRKIQKQCTKWNKRHALDAHIVQNYNLPKFTGYLLSLRTLFTLCTCAVSTWI